MSGLLPRPRGLDGAGILSWYGWTATPSGCWEFDGRRNRDGYGLVAFGGKTLLAHRFAFETWRGRIPTGMVVRHRVCDNPPCINPRHLKIGTIADNNRDAVERRRNAFGERCGASKLTASEAAEIRRLYGSGAWTQTRLADRYGVHRNTVGRVVRGEFWRHAS